jgi:hypothetical protein
VAQAAQKCREIGANNADEHSSHRETLAFLVWRAAGRLSAAVAEAWSFVKYFRHRTKPKPGVIGALLSHETTVSTVIGADGCRLSQT